MNNHGVNIAVRFFGEGSIQSVCRKCRRQNDMRTLARLKFAVSSMDRPEFLFTPHGGFKRDFGRTEFFFAGLAHEFASDVAFFCFQADALGWIL